MATTPHPTARGLLVWMQTHPDAARAPAAPVAERVPGWMGDRQTRLAGTIFAMDRRAKEGELERGGPDAIADAGVVNRIGQAAMLHAHTRFLVEALADAL